VRGLVLAGSLLGVPVGAGYAAARHHTWGDAEIQRMAYGTGLLAGFMVADWIDGLDSPQVGGGAALAGSALGFMLGDHMLRDRDFSAGQGILVDLGTVAGTLIGLGTAALVSDSAGPNQTVGLVLSTAGAAAGLSLTFASLKAAAYAPGSDADDGGAAEAAGHRARASLSVVPTFPRAPGKRVPAAAIMLSVHF